MPTLRSRILAATLVGSALALGSVSLVGAAPAYPPPTVKSTVAPTSISNPTTPTGDPNDPGAPTGSTLPSEVRGEQLSRRTADPGSSSLPLTGGDVAGIVAIGAAAAIGGGILVRSSRRHRDASEG